MKTKTLVTLWLLVLTCAWLGSGCAAIERAIYVPDVSPEGATNLVVNPMVDAAVKGVGALPFPYAGAAALLAGWAITGWANHKNKKTAVALVQGIETARNIVQDTPEGKALDEKIKRALIDSQLASGVLREVKLLLDRYTS